MFFLIQLEKNVRLHPMHFGPKLSQTLVDHLCREVEGTCSGRYGYFICVTGVEPMGKGEIRDGSGYATFPVKYQCIVFRPFKGEVLDCVVTQVNKMGFFAEAGPLQLFVSQHLIPEDITFQAGSDPGYVSSNGLIRIQKDSNMRVRIIGVRNDATEIHAVATIKEDYLGLIN
mmetsp:Transcript_63989/g.202472  ORF Transcript_63989/g.202472 Transcript_63989/m.202472 type:complete len:172 (+) Transcript_63989:154-669(+)